MAKVNVTLDTRRADKNGDFPVKLIINHNNTNASISLNFYLPEKAWIGNGIERPVKSTWPGAKAINDHLQLYYIELRKQIADIVKSVNTSNLKAADIKQLILNEKKDAEPQKPDFISLAVKYAGECKAKKTKQAYQYTVEKLKVFAKKDMIRFEDITFQFLRQFDDWLFNTESGKNTRSIHFRNIRTIINRAIDDEIIKQELYPFRKFKIKSEEKEKVSLTAEQVRTLYMYDFKTPALRMARDFWMLSFFLCGINPVDLFNMKKSENGFVSFIRAKMQGENHNVVHLMIQPEAQAIVNLYKSDENSLYLLKFNDKYVSYEIFKSFLSKKIREIAVIAGIKGLTLYMARYSWATIADGLDIQEKTISKGLGHVDRSMAGRKYITYDWSKVDRANRIVIDHILKINEL